MLSVLRVHLPSDIPIVGCELCPYVLLRCPDNSITTDDVPESSPIDGYFLRCRWYRIQNDKRVAICSVHPSKPATLQCLGCLKAKLPVSKSYHCSTKCFADAWRHHRSMHARASNAIRENGTEEDELFGQYSSTGTTILGSSGSSAVSGATTAGGFGNGSIYTNSARISEQGNGETCYEVGQGKTYTPTADDVGHALKLECVAVSAATVMAVGTPSTLFTSRVIPAPSPTPRRMIPVNSLDGLTSLDADVDGRVAVSGTFTLLSYNILADLYATSDMYSYCPPWALSWTYRRQNLLREILAYKADILCLQEVQSDHFEEFFAPELDKHGYAAVYKKKTVELFTGTAYAIDGCATFFRRDRFSLVKKYEVEFNKAAQSLSEALVPSSQRKAALSRLLKDNVALIVVLEALDSIHGPDASISPGKCQLLCVANTHIHANPELKDVKLWQVHTLLKGLEKIAASADIPMLVAGDFNSVPGSAPHNLIATGRVDPAHPDLAADVLGILRPASKLCHQLRLVSAYSAFSRLPGVGPAFEQQRQRTDSGSKEPLFTNCTRDFLGTLDYIFYTADSLAMESLLELLDEESLHKDTALPSPEWSSDHIALLAEFRCKPRPRR
ncbi:hypothetical protein O6H91_01G107700 [Diphasiastrum complanatum]|uniref:Uncharacterized protein n=2 Tax=Diphasiastrum complanatum TaxID=34168 RepID=A0ACC2EUA3_DIPCM|nr:hypothetical protein O6H91_01G107700 [Diphasiastrum complanatum]KAJ7570134.1 hypothetical protein O6H91_01G107700 [Diphasiastrum complanatum]